MGMSHSTVNDLAPSQHNLKTGESVAIRMGAPDDAARIMDITRGVIRENEFVVTEPGEFELEEEQERSWIGRHLVDAGHIILVAAIGDEVIGFLHFQNGFRKRLSHRGRFHMLIEKEFRGRGVGSALIVTLLKWAKNHPSIEKVCFAVFSTNLGAIALYKKFGFLEEGRRIGEVKVGPGQYIDDVLMYIWVGDKHPHE
jgi:RimJ/RimL family protein N-acetyltransferase